MMFRPWMWAAFASLCIGFSSSANASIDLVSRTIEPVSASGANRSIVLPSMSANGRFVAFESEATNLAAGDVNGQNSDIFVYDRDTGATELLTAGGNLASTRPSISADGRFVTFESRATNLVANDTGSAATDIFLYDRNTDTTTLISAGGNDDSRLPSISANGRFVAFESRANNLVAVSPDPGNFNLFVYDRETATSEVLLQHGNRNLLSSSLAISADGRFVSFASDASDLVAEDTNGDAVDIFVYDRDNDSIELLTPGGNSVSFSPSISADGRLVAFHSQAGNLVPGDISDNSNDIFVYDRDTNTTQQLTAGGNGGSTGARISANGRFVAFTSSANNLVAGDTNNLTDAYVYDLNNDSIELITAGANGSSGSAAITDDGLLVAISTSSNNLVPGPSTVFSDVLVFDRTARNFERVPAADLVFDVVSGNSYSVEVSVSENGRFVAYESRASDLVAGDVNGFSDIFVYDHQTGLNERVTSGANADSSSPKISADGRIVVFESDASNLGGGDTVDRTDIFAYDRDTGVTELISAGANNTSLYPAVSADGRFVAFQSFATTLVVPDSNGTSPDIFVRDRQTGAIENLTAGGNSLFRLSGDDSSPSISADGRFVVFQSSASNLAAGDTNGDDFDVFIYDRDIDTLELISAGLNTPSVRPSISADGLRVVFESINNTVPSTGRRVTLLFLYDRGSDSLELLPISDGDQHSLSADGRFVAFLSRAEDFGFEDRNGLRDIFVFDRDTQTFEWLTEGADRSSNSVSISADGQTAAFSSSATNLTNTNLSLNFSNVFVSLANDPPTADSLAISTNEDTALGVSATGFDADADDLTFEIVTPPANGEISGTAPNFVYTPNGDFFGIDVFTYSANDGLQLSPPATVTVTVVGVNDAPFTAGAVGGATEFTTAEDVPVTITLEGSDIDGDSLTYLITASPANGILSGTAPNLTYVPAADFNGSDQFSFSVSDGALTSAVVTINLTVTSTNDGPVAVPQALVTAPNVPLAIQLAGTDPDNSSLSFSLVSLPTNGNLLGDLPDLVYTAANGFAGVDSFTFTVSDGVSTSSPATVSITVSTVDSPPPNNGAPIAGAQSVTTPQETPVSIVLTGTDADGDSLIFDFVSLPANGSVSGTPPNLIYTPDVNYVGEDSFSFVVSDAEDTSAAATVSITVAAGTIELFSAVLPASRSVEVGATATAFATLINAGSVAAQGCLLGLPDDLTASFFYQASDPNTNEVIGQPNAPVDIPAGAAQSFVFGITPTEAFSARDVMLEFQCANSTDASSFIGLNTLLLSASLAPVPDLISLVATITNNGVMELSGNSGFFTAATINVGAAATITVTADTGDATLPMTLSLCQTDPETSVCINPTVPSTEPVIVEIEEGGMPTFAVFASADGAIALDPASSRVFLRLSDDQGEVRGATSVAVQNTQ